MRQLYIILSEYKALLYSSDSQTLRDQVELPEFSGAVEPFEQAIISLLEKESNLKEVKVSLVIAQRLLSFFQIQFPPISKKKVDKILPYELDSSLVINSSECYYKYNYERLKKPSRTEVVGFAIEKTLFNRLVEQVKHFGCEVKNVIPLLNLLDIKIRSKSADKNYVYLMWERDILRFFVYVGGVLKGYSSTDLKAYRKDENWQGLENEINQKLRAIEIIEYRISHTVQSSANEFRSPINADNQIELSPKIFKELENLKPDYGSLFVPTIMANKKRVNLVQFELFLLKEIKKYKKVLITGAILLTILIVLNLGQLGYQIISLKKERQDLEKKYSMLVSQYLPRGASRSNVISTLQEKLKKLQAKKELEQRFLKREYIVTTALRDISLIKQKVASLHIHKFSLNDKIFFLTGKVSSFVEFKLLKKELSTRFPPLRYKTTVTQKSSGSDTIQFSISIHTLQE